VIRLALFLCCLVALSAPALATPPLFPAPVTPRFGVQCTGACPGGYTQVGAATALGATGIRIRLGIAHPITNTTTGPRNGKQTTLAADLDPVSLVASGPPYYITLAAPANFQSGDTVTADFWPGSVSITLVSGSVFSVSVLPTQYINTSLNYGVVGPGNVIAQAQAATPSLPMDITLFNLGSPGKAGSCPVSIPASPPQIGSCSTTETDAQFDADVQYTRWQVLTTSSGGNTPPAVWTIENEEDGGNSITYCTTTCPATPVNNGDYSSVSQYMKRSTI